MDPENGHANAEIQERIRAQVEAKTAYQIRQEFNAVQPQVPPLEQDIDNNIEKIQQSNDLPRAIKGNATKMEILTGPTGVVEVVRQMVEASRNTDSPPKIAQISSPSARRILTNLSSLLMQDSNVSRVNEKNAVVLNRLIRMILDNALTTPEGLVEAFNMTKSLEWLDPDLFHKISQVLQNEAENIVSDEVLLKELKERLSTERLKTIDTARKLGKSQKINPKELIGDFTRDFEAGKNLIETITLDNMSEDDAKAYRTKLQIDYLNILKPKRSPPKPISQMSPGDITNWRRKVDLETARPDEIVKNSSDLQAELRNLVSSKILPENQYNQLDAILDGFKNRAVDYAGGGEHFRDSSLDRVAESIMGGWTDNQKNLMKGLSNLDEFQKYLSEDPRWKDRYNNFSDKKDWENFSEDVRDLFYHLFSSAESKPKDPWEQSFIEFYQGQLYRQLIGALQAVGNGIKTNKLFLDKTVAVQDFYAIHEKFAVEESSRIPNPILAATKTMQMHLGEAIGLALVNEMIDLKDLTEYSHNINYLVQLGLGFDKMAEFSARLRMHDIDRLIKSTPRLTETFNYFMENMMMQLALNNHFFPVNFGYPDINNLDPVEEMTYHQLTGSSEQEELYAESYDPKIIRWIRLASALSKGVFCDWWGVSLTARLPMEVKKVFKELDPKKYGYDKNGKPKRVAHYTYSPTFKSLNSREQEKTTTSIDLDKTLERFGGLPSFARETRFAFVPRDFNHPPEDFKWYKHADIYRAGNWFKEALINGREDEMIDWDEKYEMANENFRTNCISLFIRGGWRFYDYRRFLVPSYERNSDGTVKKEHDEAVILKDKDSGKVVLDFEATMRNMQGVGPYIVKTFIDDLFKGDADYQEDVSELSLENLSKSLTKEDYYKDKLQKLNPKWNPGDELNSDQKKLLQKLFYEKYIFEPLEETRLSHFIVMEQRRWMPRDEVEDERTLYDSLFKKLKQIYTDSNGKAIYDEQYISTHLLWLYTGAVQLVETEEFKKHEVQWRANRENAIFTGTDPMDYEVTPDLFANEEYRKKILAYLHQRTKFIGEPKGGKKFSDEEFIQHLQEYYKELSSAVKADRWRKNIYRDLNDRSKGLKSQAELDDLKETLSERYARMMASGDQGNISYFLEGNLTNLKELYFHTSGTRMTERHLGETAGIAAHVQEKIKGIVIESLPAFVQNKYENIEAIEKTSTDLFAKPFAEIWDAINNLDYDQAEGYIKKWMGFLSGLLGQDRIYRIGGVGTLVSDFLRRKHDGQWGASYMQDKFPSSLEYPSTALDSPGLHALLSPIAKAVKMQRKEKEVVGYEPTKIMGITIPGLQGSPIYAKDEKTGEIIPHKHYLEQVVNALGIDPKQRIIEAIPIMGPAVLFAIILLMAILAYNKDNKK